MDVFIVLLVLAFMALFMVMSLPITNDEGVGADESQPLPSDFD